MAFGFSVSLQISHPAIDPQEIIANIGIPADRFWSVGEERSTPKGTPLPGNYRESYCYFCLGNGDDGELAEFLGTALRALDHAAAFIAHLRETGGRINFYVLWGRGSPGEVFSTDLLARMARVGIDLGIEPLTE